MEQFGVAPRHYGHLFGLNIVGIILMALLNARLLRYYGPERLLRVGAGVAALAGCVLLLVTHMPAAIQLDGVQLIGRSSELWQVVSCLFFFVGMTGLIGANTTSLLMARHPHAAGTAAAAFGVTQFGLALSQVPLLASILGRKA